jgi:chemotaxis-related protein WspD
MDAEACWRSIGVGGDRSCPELTRFLHCRDCPVLVQAAERLRERELPEGYAEDAARTAAQTLEPRRKDPTLLVFRLGTEWLALETACIEEIASLQPVHRVAHRGGLVAGLVNVRGQLLLTVRLGDLLDLTPAPSRRPGDPVGRLIVMARDGTTWAFAVDEVEGVLPLVMAGQAPPPATLPAALAAVTTGTVPWAARRITLLSSARLFELLDSKVVP